MHPAIWLLLVVAVTHLAPDVLAELVGATPQEWFYVLTGAEAAVLCWVARDRYVSKSWSAVCWWGVYESGLQTGCGTLYMARPVLPGVYEGVCDRPLGIPMYAISVCIAAVVALVVVRES